MAARLCVGMNPKDLAFSTVSENILTITIHLSFTQNINKKKGLNEIHNKRRRITKHSSNTSTKEKNTR